MKSIRLVPEDSDRLCWVAALEIQRKNGGVEAEALSDLKGGRPSK